MPTVRFVAFKGIGWISKAIMFTTRSTKYSHIAYLLGGKKSDLIECWPQPGNRFQHWDFSHIGVHNLKTPYEIWELEVAPVQFKYIDWFFYKLASTKVKYDWTGVAGFVLKMVKDRPGRYFCSEGCMVPLKKWFEWQEVIPGHVSPHDFINIIEAAGAKKVFAGIVTQGDLNEAIR